jgi:hypothetical protein
MLSMNDGIVSARKSTPVLAIKSPIASDAVTKPACSAIANRRPSGVMSTTRFTPWRLSAAQAGRLKSTWAAWTLLALGSGGISQNTASAPAKARLTTSMSPCEPFVHEAGSHRNLRSRFISRT